MKALFLESLPLAGDFVVGSHHYANALQRHSWDLMWVSHPISPAHFVHRTKRDLAVRFDAWLRGPRIVNGALYYSPLTLVPTANVPAFRSHIAYSASALLTAPRLRAVIERAGFGQPDLLWLTDPIYASLSRGLQPRCRVVRLPDDLAAFRNVPPPARAAEEAAVDQADVVFAVSHRVYERFAGRLRSVVLLPNGVDFDHFAHAAPEPVDLAPISRPRVVYVGATEYWFDWALLAQFARARPDVSIVLLGPCEGRD